MIEKLLQEEKLFDSQPLYHYHFDLKDLELKRIGLCEENLEKIKTTFLNTLASYVIQDLNDKFVIDKTDKLPENLHLQENTLFLGKNGIDLFTSDIYEVERHKDYLDILTKDIEHLILALLALEKDNDISNEIKEVKKVETIITFLDKEKTNEMNIREQLKKKG